MPMNPKGAVAEADTGVVDNPRPAVTRPARAMRARRVPKDERTVDWTLIVSAELVAAIPPLRIPGVHADRDVAAALVSPCGPSLPAHGQVRDDLVHRRSFCACSGLQRESSTPSRAQHGHGGNAEGLSTDPAHPLDRRSGQALFHHLMRAPDELVVLTGATTRAGRDGRPAGGEPVGWYRPGKGVL